MSLELAITENTRAINALIAILRDQAANPVPAEISAAITAPAAEDPPKTRRTKKEAAPEAQPGEPAPEAPAPSPEPGAADVPATEDAATATEPLTYAQVQAATLAAVKAGQRAGVVKILDGYGAKRAGQLSEETWPEYLDALGALSDEVPF
jgi:hypothetical protein